MTVQSDLNTSPLRSPSLDWLDKADEDRVDPKTQQAFDSIALRVAANPIKGLHRAVVSLLKCPPSDSGREAIQLAKLGPQELKYSLFDTQEIYDKVLVRFVTVTEKLRVPFSYVYSKFEKKNRDVSTLTTILLCELPINLLFSWLYSRCATLKPGIQAAHWCLGRRTIWCSCRGW